ncbi:MAG: fibronectin type III domain-containing protein [Ruminiclostridium sp.]|nr:fibronectin type III domain-containing protein [Ruminiclostridium sp.]
MKNKIAKILSLVAASAVVTTSLLSMTAYAATYPSYVNSVEDGYITPVKNQGVWGACWAFSTIAASEASLNKEYGTFMDLSENLLAYTGYSPTPLGTNTTIGNDRIYSQFTPPERYLEAGGNYVFASQLLMNWYGLYEENENYPYNSSDVPSIANKEFTAKEWKEIVNSRPAQLTDYYFVMAEDEDFIDKTKGFINKYGAAAVDYYAREENGDDYSRYTNYIDGEYYYYCYDGWSVNHGVTIVGYDDSIPASYFENDGYKPGGDGGWLIKNSWGTDVYDEGYFWMSYYDPSIDKVFAYDYAMKGDDDYYDNLYSYDGAIYNFYGLSDSLTKTSAANIFKVKKGETIEGASFFTYGNGKAKYEVTLYVNPEPGNPSSGKKASSVQLVSDLNGYQTVEFPDEVKVKKGDTFSVVVTAESLSSSDYVYLFYEYDTEYYEDGTTVEMVVNEGESFISYDDSWRDMKDYYTTIGNACIKAYTNSIAPEVTGFKSGAVTSDTVALTWTKNPYATGYSIEKFDGTKWVQIAIATSPNITNYTAHDLLPGTAYKFRIRAVSADETSTIYGKYSPTLTVNTKMTGTDGFGVKSKSTTAVRLSWEKNVYADGYVIERYKNGWNEVATIKGNSTTEFKVEGLVPGTANKFRIKAYSVTKYGDTVEGDYSATLTANTLMTGVKNFTSTNKVATAVRLNWAKNEYAHGYIIEQYKSGAWTRIARIADGDTVTYRAAGLTPGDAHKFRIKAFTITKYDDVIYSEYTPTLTATTTMTTVSGLTCKSNSTSAIRLGWTKNLYAEGYRLDMFNGTKWETLAIIEGNDVTSYRIDGLKAKTGYKFRMKAYSVTKYGETIYSEKTDTFKANTATSAVSGFKLKDRFSVALRLTWTKNSAAEGYVIEQYKGDKWVEIKTITNNATTSYKVTDLLPSTKYSFRIKAYATTQYGDKTYSVYSDTLTKTTLPAAVTGLSIGGNTSNAIRLNWDKNTSADGYIIEQYKNGEWTRIARIAGNATTTYRVEGLGASTKYAFRIKAYKMSGDTALYSGIAKIYGYTNPTAVSGLAITGKAGTALRLGWDKNTTADGYIIEQYKSGKWVRIAKFTSNETLTYRVEGLAKGTTYKFRVQTFKTIDGMAYYGAYVAVSGTTNK